MVREKGEGKSRVGLLNDTEKIHINLVLHAPTVADKFVSVCGLCNEGNTVTFMKDNSVVMKKEEVIVLAKRTGVMHAIGLWKSYCKNPLLAPGKQSDLLDL